MLSGLWGVNEFSLSWFTCELWYDIVQLQRCRWVTCIVCDWLVAPCCDWLLPADIMEFADFLSSYLVTVFSIWRISWSGNASIRTPSVDRRTKNIDEEKVKVIKLAALTRERAAGDWTTSCRCAETSAGIGGSRTNEAENAKKKRQNWHLWAESISIMWRLLSHSLNSALFTCAVFKMVHHN